MIRTAIIVVVTAASISPSGLLAQGSVVSAQLDSWFAKWMAEEKIPGAAFALVEDGAITIKKGYGVSDIARQTPVSADKTVWPFGSIAKVITATAVAQLADRGRISFDADANTYLRSVKLPAIEGMPPITVRHLVTHTSALDELPGRGSSSSEEVLPLRRFLPGRLVRIGQPGQITRYSSYGSAVAGMLVEDVTGTSFHDYVRQQIFIPLKMERTTMSPRDVALSAVATAYERRDGHVVRVEHEWHHTVPSSTLFSTVRDAASFAISQLLKGSAVLSDTMTAAMHLQHATIHPAIPGWGLGWQLSKAAGVRIVEHGGDVTGFAALLVLLPDLNKAFVIVSHLEGSNLRFRIRDALVQHFASADKMQSVTASRANRGATRLRHELAGEYLANNYCRTCPSGAANAQRFTIAANADGSLTLWDQRWLPTDDPLLFASEDGKQRIGFMLNEDGTPAAVSAGAWRVLEPAPRRQ